MILYQRHVHYYAEGGDLLEQRFVLMMKNDGFHRLVTVDKPKWTSEKPFRCADAQWKLDNDSQSSPASLKQLSSKSNNEHREKAGPDQSKTMWANAVFFCHVLRIELSDLSKGHDVTSLGAKE